MNSPYVNPEVADSPCRLTKIAPFVGEPTRLNVTMTHLQAAKLVREVYGDASYGRFQTAPTEEEFDAIRRIGADVLRRMPYRAGSCGPLSAMMLAQWELESRTGLYMFAGELVGDGETIWGNSNMKESIQSQIESSQSSWDGHFWLGIGEYVLDMSLCRTAKSPGSPPKLREILYGNFPETMGLLLANSAALDEIGLRYIPHAVLTKKQVDGHILGIEKWLES